MLKHFPEIPPFEKSPSYKELGLFLLKKEGESGVSLHMFSNRWKNRGEFLWLKATGLYFLKNLCYNIKKRLGAGRQKHTPLIITYFFIKIKYAFFTTS